MVPTWIVTIPKKITFRNIFRKFFWGKFPEKLVFTLIAKPHGVHMDIIQ